MSETEAPASRRLTKAATNDENSDGVDFDDGNSDLKMLEASSAGLASFES